MLLLRLQASLIKLCDETHTLTPGPSNMRKMFILCSLLCTRRETERYCLLIWGSYDVVWLLRRICRRDRSLNRGHDDPVKDTEEVRMAREKEKKTLRDKRQFKNPRDTPGRGAEQTHQQAVLVWCFRYFIVPRASFASHDRRPNAAMSKSTTSSYPNPEGEHESHSGSGSGLFPLTLLSLISLWL